MESSPGRGKWGRERQGTDKCCNKQFLDGRLLELALRGGYREGVDSMAPSPPKKKWQTKTERLGS